MLLASIQDFPPKDISVAVGSAPFVANDVAACDSASDMIFVLKSSLVTG
jgi:hypothetical protein